ncbi:MAG: TolC family protein [Myxococcales bacterium]|nr:MAG: TolC family protein [Myxococcales bacterium]
MKTLRVVSAFILAAAVAAAPAGALFAQENGPVVTLEQARKLALQFNPSIQNVGERIYQSEMLIYKAWAMLLPSFSADGSVTLNDKKVAIEFPDLTNVDPADLLAGGDLPLSESVIQERWGQNVGFTANMAIFNARSIPLLKNAYDNEDFARASGRHQKSDLLFAVASAYYQINSAKEMVKAAEQNLENAREFLRLSRARLDVGQATKIDLLRAELDVKEQEKQLKNAQDAHALAKTALSYLIGVKEPYETAVPEPVAAVQDGRNALIEKALTDRLDLRAAHLAEEMTQREKIDTWVKWVPTFDVTYNWMWDSAAGFSGEHDSWRLIFGAKWDLLDGGLRIAELYERDSKIREAANNSRQLDLNIRQEVDTNLRELAKSRRNVEMAGEQARLAEETHHLVTRQYEIGLATSLDVLAARTQLGNARVGLIMEKLQHDLNALTLNKAVGEYDPLLKESP